MFATCCSPTLDARKVAEVDATRRLAHGEGDRRRRRVSAKRGPEGARRVVREAPRGRGGGLWSDLLVERRSAEGDGPDGVESLPDGHELLRRGEAGGDDQL